MAYRSIPAAAKEIILQDAIRRDLTTARRTALLDLLWQERYLTRAQLIARLEQKLNKHCFGQLAWEDNFYRDMRIVKAAFRAAGYRLAYSRMKEKGGYYLIGQPALSPELSQIIHSCADEVDQHQIDIYRQLSPAQRFHQGCSISDSARKVVAYRIYQENPGISLLAANRLALQRAYMP
jgi:hypothetical protein